MRKRWIAIAMAICVTLGSVASADGALFAAEAGTEFVAETENDAETEALDPAENAGEAVETVEPTENTEASAETQATETTEATEETTEPTETPENTEAPTESTGDTTETEGSEPAENTEGSTESEVTETTESTEPTETTENTEVVTETEKETETTEETETAEDTEEETEMTEENEAAEDTEEATEEAERRRKKEDIKGNNHSFSEALAISVNRPVDGALESRDDEKYYKFTLSQAGYAKVNFTHQSVNNANALWEIHLYDNQYKQLQHRASTGKERGTELAETGLPAGTYYIKINGCSSWNWSDAPYQLTVNYTAASNWESEWNDSFETADSIGFGTAVNGTVMESEDEDYYKITVPQAGYVKVNFTHESVNSSDRLWGICLYNDQYEQLQYRTSIGKERGTELTEVGLAAGTYYVKISVGPDAWRTWSDTLYKLTVNYTAASNWESEWNDSFETADGISSGKVISGTIMEENDVDYYKITIPKAGYVKVKFTHESVNSSDRLWGIRLYNDQYEQLQYRTTVGTEQGVSLTETGLAAGTYYVKISVGPDAWRTWSDKPYKLTLSYKSASDWESEWNDSFGTADSASVGKTRKGTIMESDDVDYYKIKVSHSGVLAVDFKHDSVSSDKNLWKVTIYNANYQEQASAASKGNAKSTTVSSSVAAGTYYVKVAKDYWGDWSDSVYSVKFNQYFSDAKVSLKASDGTGAKLTWKKLSGASGYEIYRSTKKSGKYEKIKTVTGGKTTSYTDKKVTMGKTYYYKVRAYKKSGKTKLYSPYSGVKSAKIKPAKVSISKVTSTSSKKAKITWKKASGASGYEIYRSTSKNGKYKKVTTVKSGKTTAYTDKKLKSKKTYYYKVRAYKNVGKKKVYGDYSKYKSVKVK